MSRYIHTEEHNRKISASMMGHPVSEETRRKMAEKRRLYWQRKKAEQAEAESKRG